MKLIGTDAATQKTRFGAILKYIATSRNLLLFFLLLIVFGYFAANVQSFSNAYNIYQVSQSGVIIGLLAIGVAIVIISGGGGIDLSVGSMLSLSGMVLGYLHIVLKVDIWLAVIGAILTGAILGAINGFLVSKVRIPPLIVTLATYYGYSAIALQMTNTQPLPDATQPNWLQSFPQEFIMLGNGNVQDIVWLSWIPEISNLGIPFQVLLIYVPVVLLVAFIIRQTIAGRALYGVGTNALAARFTALNVWGIRFWAYVTSGLLAGIAAVVQTALSASSTPTVGDSMNLQAITIAVLGGVSILGGVGSIFGVVLATIIFVFLDNGIGLMLGDQSSIWQLIAGGILLIGSVLFNEIIRKRLSAN